MTSPTEFDPAAWLAEADRIGADVYLCAGPFVPALGTEQPISYTHMTFGLGETGTDLALYETLRPDRDTAARNDRALAKYMLATGRYGCRAWRDAMGELTPEQRRQAYVERTRAELARWQREARERQDPYADRQHLIVEGVP